MPIDWGKVGETGIWVVPTAFVSAYVGSRVKAHLDRARPQITVTACRVGTLPDLIGSTVTIPPGLSLELEQCPWTPRLIGEVNAASVLKLLEKLEKNVADAKIAVGFLEKKLPELRTLEKGKKAAKLAFLDAVFRQENAIIDSAFTGGLVRGEFSIPVPADDQLKAEDKIAEYTPDTSPDGKGYLVNLGRKYYRVCGRYCWDTPLLLPAVKAICWFHVPSLEAMLVHAKKDLSGLAIDGDRLLQSLRDILKTSIPLIVEVSIVNRGRSSITFSPWGVLRLLSDGRMPPLDIPLARATSYWQPEDPVEAKIQREKLIELEDIPTTEGRFFTVESGRAVQVKYRSVEPLAILEEQFAHVTQVLAMDMFRCLALLRRADEGTVRRQWIRSSRGIFGICGESFPHQEMTEVKKIATIRKGLVNLFKRGKN